MSIYPNCSAALQDGRYPRQNAGRRRAGGCDAQFRPVQSPLMISIRAVTPVITAPAGINLVVVKVDTSEPGLYGLGCATFTQRCLSVASAVSDYLEPLLVGRDPDRIEDIWKLMMVHAYWRNGPVLNSAVSGVDMALWDIKAKRAGMPLYQLLGGRMRGGATVYRHAGGKDHKQIEDQVAAYLQQGVRHVRVQLGPYGGLAHTAARPEGVYGGPACGAQDSPGAPDGAYYDPRLYMRTNLAALEYIRARFGPEVELLHDVHERLAPSDAVQYARTVEPLRLFFLEDVLAPEDIDWFANIRQTCVTPLAMGELFVNIREWLPLVSGRLIDFIRMHISAIGGLTPARKAAAVAEAFGVRTAWHGPGDVSPVGHAVNVHLDLASPNFGIQEFCGFDDATREVFPGAPEQRGGCLYVNERPGHGVDIDLKAAARYPPRRAVDFWTQARLPDGTIARP